MSEEPLLDVFQELRRRGFALGVDEYLLALKALQHGFGALSREDLILTCQTLWAKTCEQQSVVTMVLERMLPPLWKEKAADSRAEPPPEPELRNDEPALSPQEREPGLPNNEPTLSRPERLQPEGYAPLDTARTPVSVTAEATTRAGGILAPAQAERGVRRRRFFNLQGELPINRRHMERAWRYYRRMRRVGPRIAVDLDATVEQIHRLGVFAGAVLIPQRRNLARVLILVDVGGSMIPFRREVLPLLASAREASLALVRCLYFHDVPIKLFCDEPLLHPIALEEAAEPFVAAGILIVSDGGAARGQLDVKRVNATTIQLDRFRCFTLNLAWLNPMPYERWIGTTAGEIARLVEMFAFDRASFDQAIGVLRGRSLR